MTPPRLGPVQGATLVTADLAQCTASYRDHLHLRVHSSGVLSDEEAGALGWPALGGTSWAWLANPLDEPWLRLIENPDADPLPPFEHYGWLSLEISVQDVDALGESLKDSPFEIIGPPANLAVGEAIRAMQVVGPCGEVLYLTEIKAPLPPFELPRARCPVDRLFIPVMMAPDREAALGHYEERAGAEGLRFETRITVISGARGLDREHPHPVATLQLPSDTLIEIDQVHGLAPAPYASSNPPTGIALAHFAPGNSTSDREPVYATGAAGERYLIQPH
jgi:catechol 2,3-dioxygenase-like lactoylglutathione lyase family enzyme